MQCSNYKASIKVDTPMIANKRQKHPISVIHFTANKHVKQEESKEERKKEKRGRKVEGEKGEKETTN